METGLGLECLYESVLSFINTQKIANLCFEIIYCKHRVNSPKDIKPVFFFLVVFVCCIFISCSCLFVFVFAFYLCFILLLFCFVLFFLSLSHFLYKTTHLSHKSYKLLMKFFFFFFPRTVALRIQISILPYSRGQ